MTFAAPWVLLALPLVALLAIVGLRWRRRQQPAGIPHPSLALIAAADPGPRARRWVAPVLALLALVALLVALARPQIWRDEPREQATIVLAIDVSGSMAADDVAPDRLRAAQDAALRFAESVPRQYLIGLVSFSGTANVLVPPTTDRLAFSRAVEGLRADGATAVGDAVHASLESIRAVQGADPDATLEAARILLLSDGASTTGLLTEVAAAEAARAEVPVFTVSLGTPDGRIYNGQPVPPDPQELAEIAATTGGQAFESRDAESVAAVYERLGSFIGTERVRGEATAWPAGLAALLLVGAGVAAWRFGPRLS